MAVWFNTATSKKRIGLIGLISGGIDAYIMAIARHSNDGGKWCDEDGIFYYDRL